MYNKIQSFQDDGRTDIQAYIRKFVNNFEAKNSFKSWLNFHHLSESEFSEQLTAKSENNFMYISQILAAIIQGFYAKYEIETVLENWLEFLEQQPQYCSVSRSSYFFRLFEPMLITMRTLYRVL